MVSNSIFPFSGDSQRIYVDWVEDEGGSGDIFFEFNLLTGEVREDPDLGRERDSDYIWTLDRDSVARLSVARRWTVGRQDGPAVRPGLEPELVLPRHPDHVPRTV